MTPEVKNELKRAKKRRKIRRRAPRPEGEEEGAEAGGADDEREGGNGRDVDGAAEGRDDYFDGSQPQKKGVLGWFKGWFGGGK